MKEENQLQCPKCGTNVAGEATFCNICGQPMASSAATEENNAPSPWVRAPATSVAYAGFWLRLVAYVIDLIGARDILVGFAILMPLMQRAGISEDNPWALFTTQSRQIAAINMLVTMAAWLYWALMESSPWQATLGKKARLGLRSPISKDEESLSHGLQGAISARSFLRRSFYASDT